MHPDENPIKVPVPQSRNKRVYVRLSWCPKADTLLHRSNRELWKNDKTYDFFNFASDITLLYDHFPDDINLDLSCYAYDKYGNFVSLVSPATGHESSEDGEIYHSGNNVSGHGSTGEEISLLLGNLTDKYAHMVFLIDSMHHDRLSEIADIEIALVDGASEKPISISRLALDKGNNALAAVACIIYYKNDAWYYKSINDMIDRPPDWPSALKEYL